MELNTIYNQNCLEGMKTIPDKSIDCIICDLPYGSTNCSWDSRIDLNLLWEQYKRIIKDNGAIILFGSEPFSSILRLSNLKMYKYDLIWKKEKPTNFFQLKRRFGKCTEYLHVFYKKQPTYHPQMIKHEGPLVKNNTTKSHNSIVSGIGKQITPYKDTGYRYPCDILEFNRVKLRQYIHPTQKPVELLEYLIKTYSNEGDIILDNCIGSGSTAIACINTNRNYIGYESDTEFYNKCINRIQNHVHTKN